LTKLLAEHAPRAATLRRVEDYRGRVIAIDASLSIYQFLVSHLTSIPSTPLTPFRFDSSAVRIVIVQSAWFGDIMVLFKGRVPVHICC
jgi:hypothetical protein